MVKAARKPKKTAASLQDAVTQSLGGDITEAPADGKSGVKRDEEALAVPPERAKLVGKWCSEVRADKKYFEKVYKRMRKNMEYARLGADKKWVDGGNYTVPIINRFINQAVAVLYAKNPKAVAKRKPKLHYTLWDGTQASAQAAFNLVQMGADADGSAEKILQEAQEAKSYNQMMDRAGRTLEILFEYYTGEDFPDFKKRLKAAVRRAKTTGVAYVEVSFHRAMEADPDITQRIGDMTAKINDIKSKQADLQDGIIKEDDVEAQELASELITLEQEKMKITSEGLMFDFPRSLDIIPHRACTQLAGFIGADYTTREYLMTPELIQSTFSVDIKTNYKEYTVKGADSETAGNTQEGDRGDTNTEDNQRSTTGAAEQQTKGKACVWRVMNKKTREEFWLCDGYPDYLRAPRAPESQVHGFWYLFSLTFNEVEDEKEIFPLSDVDNMEHPQREYNNVREGLREHRRANRPLYFSKKGMLEEEEKDNLGAAAAHDVVELKALEGNTKIDEIIQPRKGAPIDPNLYETGSIIKDILYGVGAQQADMGQTGDATATESSIAEQSRSATLASNVDDLDEFLSEIARAASQILLQQMSKQTVIEIVGPGAVWPELDGQTIARELFLEVKAGSSGRPNQAADLANLERSMQYMLQLGNINPTVLARKFSMLNDFDEDELIVEGLPSIQSMNAAAAQKAQAESQMQTGNNEAKNQVAVAHATGQVGPPGGGGPAGASAGPAGAPQANNTNQGANAAAGANNAPAQPGPVGPMAAHPAPVYRYNAQGVRQ